MNNQSVLKLDTACKEDILQSCQMGFMKIVLPAKSNADTRPCMYVDTVMASMFGMADNLSPQACYTYWASRIIAQESGPQCTPNVQIRTYTWNHPHAGALRFSSRISSSKDENGTVIKAMVERISYDNAPGAANIVETIKSILEYIPMGAELWDKDLNFIDSNSLSYKKFTEHKEEYLKGFYNYSPEFQPDGQRSSEKCLQSVKKAFDKGVYSVEWMQQTKDGAPIPLIVTIVTISDDYALVFTYDKREEIETHLRLEEAKEKQEIIYENIPLGLFLWEPERVMDCNAHLLNMLNIGDKDVYLKTYLDSLPLVQENGQNSRSRMLFYQYKAIEEGYCKFPFTIQSFTGEVISTEITIYSIMHDEKSVNYCFVRDLREEMELRKEIEKNLSYMQIVLDACPLGVSLWNTPDKALYFNYKIYAMLGLKCKADFHEAGDFFAFSPELQPCGTSSYDKAYACNNKALEEGSYTFDWMHVDIYNKPVPTEVTLVRTKVKGEDLLLAYVRDLREIQGTKGADPCVVDLANAVDSLQAK